jgi:hypothetical protein
MTRQEYDDLLALHMDQILLALPRETFEEMCTRGHVHPGNFRAFLEGYARKLQANQRDH